MYGNIYMEVLETQMLLVEKGGFRQCGTYNESAKIRRKAVFVLFCFVEIAFLIYSIPKRRLFRAFLCPFDWSTSSTPASCSQKIIKKYALLGASHFCG